jgi:hypothetical protein
MRRSCLAMLILSLCGTGCAHQSKTGSDAAPAAKISGSMGIGVSSGGYGRNRHP